MTADRSTAHGYRREIDVIEAASDGDQVAMKSIYETHVGYLAAVCSRYISDDQDVKDVLQESFIKIFTHLRKFHYRGPGSLRAWMSRIVVNDSLKFLRDSGMPTVSPMEVLPDAVDEADDIEGITPEQMHRMIRALPRPYRTVFNLYVFERLGHKDIARQLGMAPGTSASCLHRAKNMLVKMVKDYKDERAV